MAGAPLEETGRLREGSSNLDSTSINQMVDHKRQGVRGRGAGGNPPNRFETLWYVQDEDWTDPEDPAPQTHFLKDTSRSLITTNDSPDVGFNASINPYRGCEHGCVYCYARPTHEYLGFSAGLDFETKILVKQDAPGLLKQELSSPNWKPQVLAMSGVTDPYQPIERRLKLSRACLKVLAQFRSPVSIITKNYLVTRDRDVLERLNRHGAISVAVSITTLDRMLAGLMEPRTSRPSRRLEAIRQLTEAGIPTGVMVAPVIPGLTDHELPTIVEAAAEAGATFAGYLVLRLPYGVKSLFERWLDEAVPEKKNKVLNRIRSMRGGKLNDPRFYSRHRGEGIFADEIARMFSLACSRAGIGRKWPKLSTAAFRRTCPEPAEAPGAGQLVLFD